jgi:hypothetical protein
MNLPPGTVSCRTDWKSVLRRCRPAPQTEGLNKYFPEWERWGVEHNGHKKSSILSWGSAGRALYRFEGEALLFVRVGPSKSGHCSAPAAAILIDDLFMLRRLGGPRNGTTGYYVQSVTARAPSGGWVS